MEDSRCDYGAFTLEQELGEPGIVHFDVSCHQTLSAIGKRRSTQNRDTARGTPQGSPISPLLANVYMRRFILGWQRLGLQQRFGAHIVNYADDLVICCRHGAGEALTAMRRDRPPVRWDGWKPPTWWNV